MGCLFTRLLVCVVVTVAPFTFTFTAFPVVARRSHLAVTDTRLFAFLHIPCPVDALFPAYTLLPHYVPHGLLPLTFLFDLPCYRFMPDVHGFLDVTDIAPLVPGLLPRLEFPVPVPRYPHVPGPPPPPTQPGPVYTPHTTVVPTLVYPLQLPV